MGQILFNRLQTIQDIFKFIIAAMIIIPGIFLAIFSYCQFKDEQLHTANHMRETAVSQSDAIQAWFDDQQEKVQSIAKMSFVRNADKQAMEYNFKEFVQIDPDIDAIIFINKQGISEPQYIQTATIDLSDREYFKAGLQGQDYITDVIIGRSSGKPIIIFSSPVYGFDGSFQGVVFGSVMLNTIEKILEGFNVGSTGKTFLVDKSRKLVAFSKNENDLHFIEEIESFAKANLGRQEDPQFSSYKNSHGITMMRVYQPIPKLQWSVIAQIEMAELLNPFYRQLGILALLYLLMLIAFLPVTYWLTKRIKNPIEKLTATAQNIRQGNYDYIIPDITITYMPKELKLLCDTFKQMAMEIKNSVDRLNGANEILQYISRHDSLTGLCNRACFDTLLHGSTMNDHNSIGLIVCDVDGLKIVNDTLGHQAGDRLLQAAAALLTQGVGEADVVARIGGDEFAILLPGANTDIVQGVCKRIKEAMEVHNTEDHSIPLYISAGYAVHQGADFNADRLFREADDRMYLNKEMQRNFVRKKLQARLR